MQLPTASDPTESLKNNLALTPLDLSHSYVGPKGATDLATRLKTNTLSDLNLRDTYLGTQGCITIAEALQANTSLRSLDLSHCLIDFDGGEASVDRGAKAIADALRANETLSVLHISFNGTGPEGIIAIVLALQENSTLHTLGFYHCNFSMEVQTEIIELLEENTSLTTIQFFYEVSPLQVRIDNLIKRNRCIASLTNAASTEDISEVVAALAHALNKFPLIESISTRLHPRLIDVYNHCCNNLCLILIKMNDSKYPSTDPTLKLMNSYPQIKQTLVNILYTHESDQNEAARYRAILFLLRFDLDNAEYKWITNTCLARLQNKSETISQIESRHSLLTAKVTDSKDNSTTIVSTEFLVSFDKLKQVAQSVTEKYQAHPDAPSYQHRISYFSFLCTQSYTLATAVRLLRWPETRAVLNLGEHPIVMLEEFLVNPTDLAFIHHEPLTTHNPELLARTLLFSSNNSNRLVELCALETQRFLNKDSDRANSPLSVSATTDSSANFEKLITQLVRFKEIYDSLYRLKQTHVIATRARDKTAHDSVVNTSKTMTYKDALTHHHRALIRLIFPHGNSEGFNTENIVIENLCKPMPIQSLMPLAAYRKDDGRAINCMDILKARDSDMELIDRMSGLGNITKSCGAVRDRNEHALSILTEYLGLDDVHKEASNLNFDTLQFYTILNIKCIMHQLIGSTIKYLFYLVNATNLSRSLLEQVLPLYPAITNTLRTVSADDIEAALDGAHQLNVSLAIPPSQDDINRCMQRLTNHCAKFPADESTEMLFSLLEKLKLEVDNFKTNIENLNQEINEAFNKQHSSPSIHK